MPRLRKRGVRLEPQIRELMECHFDGLGGVQKLKWQPLKVFVENFLCDKEPRDYVPLVDEMLKCFSCSHRLSFSQPILVTFVMNLVKYFTKIEI